MKCSECPAECCKFDVLGKEALSDVAAAVRMTYDDFIKIFHQRQTKSGYCPYLNKDNYRCTIYDERPSVCRNYFCKDWEQE